MHAERTKEKVEQKWERVKFRKIPYKPKQFHRGKKLTSFFKTYKIPHETGLILH
jgi:hypothetical protein